MLTIASPPLKEVRELAQRSMCKGGMFITESCKKLFSLKITAQ